MDTEQKCDKHQKQYTKICLAQDCQVHFLMCQQCDLSAHKHSKTQISLIKDIQSKLKSSWQPKQSVMDGYIKKTRLFYQQLKKQLSKLIDQDQHSVQTILTKLKYHHLPIEANSLAYIQLMKHQYDRLDKKTIVTLINQAQNGQQNKDMEKQKYINKFLDLELKKVNDKVLTLKYILLSKKLQAQMLMPKLSQESKVAVQEQFVKIYSLFNSRKMLIRSAKLIYRAKQNDFSSQSFYNRCIDMHNCLAIVKTKNNKVYGGYSSSPLVYHDQQQLTQKDEEVYQKDDTKKSFIFSLTPLKSYSLKDSQRSLIYKPTSTGPSFGVDLQLGLKVTSSLGHSYESPQNVQVDSLESKVYLLEAEVTQALQMEVWQICF